MSASSRPCCSTAPRGTRPRSTRPGSRREGACRPGWRVHREVDGLQRGERGPVEERFPKLNRCLTGYDLAHIWRADGHFDLTRSCAARKGRSVRHGSDVKCCRFRAHRRWSTFATPASTRPCAMRRPLMKFGRLRARRSTARCWRSRERTPSGRCRGFFPEDEGERARGVNIIEFVGNERRRAGGRARPREAALDAAGRRGPPRLHGRARRDALSGASGRCARSRSACSAT